MEYAEPEVESEKADEANTLVDTSQLITEHLDHRDIPNCPYQDYGILCRKYREHYVTNISNSVDIGWGQQCPPRKVIFFAEVILNQIFGESVSLNRSYVLHFADAILSSMPEEGGRIPITEVLFWFDDVNTSISK